MLDDTIIKAIPRRSLARHIGLLLQEENREFWGSVTEYVLLGRYPYARGPFGWSPEDERIARLEMEAMHLSPLGERAYASLSGGERQRARAAALFTQQPLVYLLDEPLQHLDIPHQVTLLERLSKQAIERGAVVIMALHDLLLAARYCSRYLLLYGDGQFSLGTAENALTADHLTRLYGFPFASVEADGERLFLPAKQSGQGPDV
jgi:iron complex transport system ATP-binding protein